jgi:DNA-binding phage protein
MAITFSRYDTADYLKTEADITAYLTAAAEEGDPSVMAAAQQDAERARSRWLVRADLPLAGHAHLEKPEQR